jgi:predicted ATPase
MAADRVPIADAIIAGIASCDSSLDQMVQIVANLEHAGFVIAPKEPTQIMLDEVTAADQREPFSDKTIAEIYRAMIGACT